MIIPDLIEIILWRRVNFFSDHKLVLEVGFCYQNPPLMDKNSPIKELQLPWTLLLTSIHTAAVSEEGPKVAKFLDR